MNLTSKLSAAAVPFLVVTALLSADAEAQPAPPPPAVVASYTPVYYNGFAHYLYADHWYYRDRTGAWRWYEHEPAYLGGYRARWESYHHRWR